MNIEVKTKIKYQDRLDVSVLLVRKLNEKVRGLEEKVEILEENVHMHNNEYKCYSCREWVYQDKVGSCERCTLVICHPCIPSSNLVQYDGFFGCRDCYKNIVSLD